MNTEQAVFLADVRGYILACIGDEEGKRAVERNRMLSLTAGQVQALAEALELLEAAATDERLRLAEFAVWMHPTWEADSEDDQDSARRAVEAFLEARDA